jgi:sugar transferase (PEP-CTERM/EpsH1 system associated)
VNNRAITESSSGGGRGLPAVPAAEVPSPGTQVAHSRPLIAHIIYRLDVGGLENGLVNLINHTPQYRHAIICMTVYTDYSRRITHDAVTLYALHKREGQDIGIYVRLWGLLRRLRPTIVHTRNLATLEAQLPAFLAGVPGRVHGEHGWDVHDLDGSSRKYQWLRRAYRHLVQRYIPLSADLENYLRLRVKVKEARIVRIYNGVDTTVFQAPAHGRQPLPVDGLSAPGTVVIGTVGRMQAVKDPLNLVRAFVQLSRRHDVEHEQLRLVMIGDGPLRREALDELAAAGLAGRAWLPGARDDIAALLRCLDIFVLPSRAEGISNTILEAMASALPVVATRVGGNAELVAEGICGALVPSEDPVALADAIATYVHDPALRCLHGRTGRERVEQAFGIEGMIKKYVQVYDTILQSAPRGD